MRLGSAVAVLGIGLATVAVMPSASASVVRPPATLVVPGDAYYPESTTAAANGDLYVASITTGQVVVFRSGVWAAETFIPVGVNLGTAGVLFDDATPSSTSAAGGTLSVWSADQAFTYPTGGLQINGIAYDGRSAIYTTNHSAGTLVRVGIAADCSALEATKVPIPRLLQNPDGIRMLDANRLLVTENPGALNVIDVRSGKITQVGTFDQPTSVVRSGGYLWVAEGQVLRLQQGQPPNLPFKIQRAPVPITDL